MENEKLVWKIEYYNSKVEAEILNLPEGLLARYFRLTDLMIEFGANLGMPHTKAIENRLVLTEIIFHNIPKFI